MPKYPLPIYRTTVRFRPEERTAIEIIRSTYHKKRIIDVSLSGLTVNEVVRIAVVELSKTLEKESRLDK